MSYRLQFSFDNSHRLSRKRYLFEYRGVVFELIQDSPRKFADHLLTIVPQIGCVEDETAFRAAAEFLSALAWQNRSTIALWPAGAVSWPGLTLKDATRAAYFSLPRIPGGNTAFGFDLTQIPDVKTDEQRIALALYREATASNSDYLAFLFFRQILTLAHSSPEA